MDGKRKDRHFTKESPRVLIQIFEGRRASITLSQNNTNGITEHPSKPKIEKITSPEPHKNKKQKLQAHKTQTP